MSARDDYPMDAFEMWREGVEYTHEHYIADSGKFVGRVPAVDHRAAEQAVIAMVPQLLDEIDRLRAGLVDAREMVADWAGYASEYFQTKWNLAGDLEQLDQLIANATRVTNS